MPPSFWAYLRAHIRLIEAGLPPTQVNLAKELGIKKQSVWGFQRRHPEIMAWIDEQLAVHTGHYFTSVQRRMAFMAMQGSVQAAEAYFKSIAGAYAPRAGGFFGDNDPGDNPALLVQPQQIYLIPRPPTPQLAAPPAPAASPLPDIPTVAVR